ncbi:hypothetical protein A3C23_02335 [Candidatus Roizmanbacteria bacterium RIFCSPHIGHO2_02_FULL_37_13b]|uniref:Methyltransferase type 11 domain-containing protein n=1 Tax=Candidatus Roizmanbacteria bacterium RIFCSPLOWO2_02_FULL_36_11 TaxID=1802071 RepID=A0A1F7JJ13_9BACT|nr:MAG: hypothetical protein A3C23_02335 [Candidatus Roizmanbacteria bacterium RIFCSPHIGHO2_02_FULL_37_13b]OGK55598.1 MAG: hypothetical protein A3H78_01440 [Candidatus Roizmanbacteria bacterium RIFCSPLOWO2_02_FULL_36_11]
MDVKDSNDSSWFIPETTAREGRERNLEMYEGFLGFNREDLRDKTILDLGSGETERFSRELKDAGIKTTVICLNPDYGLDNPNRFREIITGIPDWQHQSVAATAQSLPFAAESFDFIFANYSVTVFASPHLKSTLAKQWASELARVLKPGGEARLAPIYAESYKDEYQDLDSIWKKAGLTVNIQDITIADLGLTDMYPDPNQSSGQSRLIIKKPTQDNQSSTSSIQR